MDELQTRIYSDAYGDLILPCSFTSEENFLSLFKDFYPSIINNEYAMIHIPIKNIDQESSTKYVYSIVPDLFTLLDTTSLEVSGILKSQTQPALALTGKGILVGIIDTGIHYTHPSFLDSSGKTRILAIWDQTIPSENNDGPFGYGTIYTREDINEALSSPDPFLVVPSDDKNGHGTFIAGAAAGSDSPENNFTGAAPEAMIAVVKLKEAKQNIKDYYFYSGSAPVYQENDIMTAIQYLVHLAGKEKMPMALCLAFGTNQGDHTGYSPLCISIRQLDTYLGLIITAASGNEGGKSHHYYNFVPSVSSPRTVEIFVRENTKGFFMELWGQPPESFSIGFRSPVGEVVPRIPVRLGKTEVVNLFLENTRIYVGYELVQNTSGSELIFVRFEKPSPGIWNVDVYCTARRLEGNFHIWLPVSGFTQPDVTFLTPDPDTTITMPGNSIHVITPSTYNAYTDGIFLDSGRGYTRNNLVKPDFSAPGVNVTGPDLKNGYITRSGSSVSAAITTGCAALLMEWGMKQKNIKYFSTYEAKSYMIRGASRNPLKEYPNREWGYGTLNLYDIFSSISTT